MVFMRIYDNGGSISMYRTWIKGRCERNGRPDIMRIFFYCLLPTGGLESYKGARIKVAWQLLFLRAPPQKVTGHPVGMVYYVEQICADE